MRRAYLDTNWFLQFKRPDQLDWCSALLAEEVILVIAPVVLRELECKKVDSRARLRDRATSSVKWLYERHKAGGTVRQGVSIAFLTEEPTIDFAAHKLSLHIEDDWLLAHIIEDSQRGLAPVLIVDDLGLLLKAESRGIQTVRPYDEWRLPPPDDPAEAEARRLRSEIEKMRNATPRMQLVNAKSDNDRFTVYLYPVPAELPGVVPQPHPGPLDLFTSGDFRLLGKYDMGDREQRRKARDDEWERYRDRYAQYLRRARLTMSLDIRVENIGVVPAEDVDIWVELPKGVVSRNRLRKPSPPQGAIEREALSVLLPLPAGYQPPRKWEWHERRSAANVHLDGVKHGYVAGLPSLEIMFEQESDVGPFQIRYVISTGRPPQTDEGILHVIPEERTARQAQTDS